MSPAEAACPRCHAQLDVELLRDSGARTCPFCEADVSAALETAGPFETRSGWGKPESWPSDSSEAAPPPVDPLPAESRLQIVQVEEGRLVLFLPPGGRAGNSLWVFVFVFTAILAFITGVFVMVVAAGPAQQPQGPGFLLLMLGIFWLVTLGVWWGALKMRYQRTLLSVDRERVVVQTTLFGKTRQQELPVSDITGCSLVVAYSVNDVPVYRVQVANSNQSLGFATNLDQADKVWLVEQIRRILPDSSVADATA